MSKLVFITLIIISHLYLLSCQETAKDLKPLAPPQEITPLHRGKITIKNYCLSNTSRVNFFLHNPYVRLTSKGVQKDFDGDGITDEEEVELEHYLDINHTLYDTRGDNYSDLIVKLGGYTIDQQQRFPRCDNPVDQDNDGLLDCVESLIGTSDQDFDSDNDGIPDILELYFGTNPLVDDAYIDTDKDGVNNIEEIRRGTPIRESNNHEKIQDYSMIYDMTEVDVPQEHIESYHKCYRYTISQIPLNEDKTENIISLYFIESEQIEGSQKNTLIFKKINMPSQVSTANDDGEVQLTIDYLEL